VVCDPTCGSAEVALRILAKGCDVICIEEDWEKCKVVTQQIENWIAEPKTVEDSCEDGLAAEDQMESQDTIHS
jgi:hypothetical protein